MYVIVTDVLLSLVLMERETMVLLQLVRAGIVRRRRLFRSCKVGAKHKTFISAISSGTDR